MIECSTVMFSAVLCSYRQAVAVEAVQGFSRQTSVISLTFPQARRTAGGGYKNTQEPSSRLSK